jgi:hypothetical protein
MTETGQNVEIYRGDSKVLRVTVVDENNLSVDISSFNIEYVLYKKDITYLSKTIGSGISFVGGGTTGIFDINYLPVDTENIYGNFFHECEITDPTSQVSTVFTGSVTIINSKI